MTQRSVTYLKGKFETGDIPTQSDYGDLMDSFLNLEASAAQSMSGKLEVPAVSAATVSANNVYVNGKLFHSNSTAVSAALGTQAGATRLANDVNLVFGNDVLGFGVVMASAEPGRVQYIINTNTTVLTVFPASGCNFVGTAENTGSIVLAKNSMMVVAHCGASAYSAIRGTI